MDKRTLLAASILVFVTVLCMPALSDGMPSYDEINSGKVVVYSSDPSLKVFFDEDPVGKCPVVLEPVKRGRHVVEAYSGKDLVFRKYIVVGSKQKLVVKIRSEKEIAKEDPNLII